MERGEREPRITWYNDAEGYYFNIKTEMGVFELRDTDTAIFKFGDEHRDLDHIYRITGEDEERFMGFRIYRYQLEDKGFNFDQLCLEMRGNGFDEIYEDVPNQEEIDAYINAGNTFPIVRKLPDVEVILLKYDAEFEYYLGPDGDWRI